MGGIYRRDEERRLKHSVKSMSHSDVYTQICNVKMLEGLRKKQSIVIDGRSVEEFVEVFKGRLALSRNGIR